MAKADAVCDLTKSGRVRPHGRRFVFMSEFIRFLLKRFLCTLQWTPANHAFHSPVVKSLGTFWCPHFVLSSWFWKQTLKCSPCNQTKIYTHSQPNERKVSRHFLRINWIKLGKRLLLLCVSRRFGRSHRLRSRIMSSRKMAARKLARGQNGMLLLLIALVNERTERKNWTQETGCWPEHTIGCNWAARPTHFAIFEPFVQCCRIQRPASNQPFVWSASCVCVCWWNTTVQEEPNEVLYDLFLNTNQFSTKQFGNLEKISWLKIAHFSWPKVCVSFRSNIVREMIQERFLFGWSIDARSSFIRNT